MLPTLMSVIICLGSRVTCVQAWDFAPALVVGSGGGGGGDAANGYEGCGGGGSGGRARSHCRFVLPFAHFIPDSRIHSVPRVLRRQCDRTLGFATLGEDGHCADLMRQVRPPDMI